MSHSRKTTVGLAALMCLVSASPVLADASTEAFIATTQHAISTLNSMQALFARMDQRKAAQAAGTTTTTTPAPTGPEQPQK